jgi:integrase
MSEKRIIVWVQRFNDRPNLVLQWNDPFTGQRKSKSAETNIPAVAEMKRTELEYELNHGLHKEASRMSWDRFRELFETEFVAGRRENTRENYKAMFDLFERLCSPQTIRGVSERTVSSFVAKMRKEPGRYKGEEGMRPSTIKVRLQFLHTALSWATEQKFLPEVPKFPTVKVPKKDPQSIPPELFERMLAKAPDENMRVFLLCGWLAGLRLSEAFALEWEETEEAPYLDFARNRIILPAEYVKGSKDEWLPLDPELRAALEALPRPRRKVFRFVNRHGKPLLVNSVSRLIVRLAAKAGVKLTMKVLRRGFGCRYAGKVPAQVLQKLMRHANISTTMDYYANIDVAVEQAVLGDKRNTSRNATADSPPRIDSAIDANHYQEDVNSEARD